MTGVEARLPCPSGKQQHETKKQAQGQLASLRNNPSKARGRTSAYRCDFCGFWHVGRR